jgi:hypothetical protein
MTPEQHDAVCEYVDGMREAGRRYDEIAQTLEGKLPESALERLEESHRRWKRREWRNELKRLHEAVSLDNIDVAETPSSGEEFSLAGGRDELETVRYLAQRLIGLDVIEDGESRWKPLCMRALNEGQTCEMVKGPGQANGCAWRFSAVIFRTGTRIDHVEPEARIRRRVPKGSHRAAKYRFRREAVEIERLNVTGEKLDKDQICARLAALLQTYLGRASGIKSGAHLARLTNRTRQAVSARKLLIAEDYYKRTGGRAGFEGLSSAARHREKVAAATHGLN